MENQEIRLRKYEHILRISGSGVIAFGLWSILKAILVVLLNPLEQFSSAFPEELQNNIASGLITERQADATFAVFILLVLLVDVLMRLYIGRSAVRDGSGALRKRHGCRGKKKGPRRQSPVYIGWAVLMGALLISSIITTINSVIRPEIAQNTEIFDQMSVSWLVDLTSLLALAEMVWAAIVVRRLRAQIADPESAGMESADIEKAGPESAGLENPGPLSAGMEKAGR